LTHVSGIIKLLATLRKNYRYANFTKYVLVDKEDLVKFLKSSVFKAAYAYGVADN